MKDTTRRMIWRARHHYAGRALYKYNFGRNPPKSVRKKVDVHRKALAAHLRMQRKTIGPDLTSRIHLGGQSIGR